MSKCEEHSPGHNDDDCCSLDQHVFCGDGYQVSKVKKGEDVNWINRHERSLSCSQGGGYRGNTCCSPYGESNDAADMTPSNMSIARFVGTGNSGEVFVPEPKKVLCKEHACSIANDASTCCIATCDSIENGVAFCNEIGIEGGLVDNAAMIQCKGTACTSKVDGMRCCKPTCREHVTTVMCAAINRVYDQSYENRFCTSFKCRSKKDLEICCKATCASADCSCA